MKLYYPVYVKGLLDLRPVQGPYEIMKYAVAHAERMANEIPSDDMRHPDPKRGQWYAVHPFGRFVDGPYETQAIAERERRKNLKEYGQDCCYDEGFTAKVVKPFKDVAVVMREFRP